MAGTDNVVMPSEFCIDESDSIEGDSASPHHDLRPKVCKESPSSRFIHPHDHGRTTDKIIDADTRSSSGILYSEDHLKHSSIASEDSGLGSIARSAFSSSTGSTSSEFASKLRLDSSHSTKYSSKSSGYSSQSSDTSSALGDKLRDLTLQDTSTHGITCSVDSSKGDTTSTSVSKVTPHTTTRPDQHSEATGSTQYSDGFELTDDALRINEDGDMSLHLSIIFMREDVALILIPLFPTKFLSHANKLFQTPLHLSVLTRQPRITRALVLAGANLEVPDRNGNTALHLACINNYLDCVGALTHRPSIKEVTDYLGETATLRLPQLPQSLEIKNYEGYTCVHIATFSANSELLTYLVQLGANVNAADDKSGRRPIHYAIEKNNLDLANLLLRRLGANVNSTTFDLNTPIHLAAGRGHLGLVHLLMDQGASREAANSEGLRPFEMTDSEQIRRLLGVIEFSDFTIAGM